MNQRIIYELVVFQGDIRKLNPPTFDGEKERGDDGETWFLGVKKQIQLHSHSSNLEATISIYHLHGKYCMWWDYLKQVKHIDEKNHFLEEIQEIIPAQVSFRALL
jgi:hypothetical protein